jgi:glycosyltransferase
MLNGADHKSQITNHKSRFTVVRCWKSSPFDAALLNKGWMPPHPTFFVKRVVYEKYGGFDTTFKIAADYELMIRFLGEHGISTRYIPEFLVKMRVGGASNKSIRNIIIKSSEDYRVMKMHHIEGQQRFPQEFRR